MTTLAPELFRQIGKLYAEVPAPEFPEFIRQKGRLYAASNKVDNYIRSLAGLPELPPDPSKPVELIPAKVVAQRLGFGRRTLGRRLVVNVKTAAA
jgi:hypothetical protein